MIGRWFRHVMIGLLIAPTVHAADLMDLSLEDLLRISVASGQEELRREAPVITSVITEKQIKRMGARTLMDVLMTVPGFSHAQDHNEWFSVERGIYASSQQKILIMRDGHRLNNRSYSEANDDHAISLANVKSIEIMRGPGASLYGDVALTAVINLISKNGADIDGTEVTLGGGNHGQKKADLLFGKKFQGGHDLSLFGSFYESLGQTVAVTDPRSGATGEEILYGFRDNPSYDAGVAFQFPKNLRLSYERRYGHYVEPLSGSGPTGQIYDYDDFMELNGTGPGLGRTMDHADVTLTPTVFGDSELKTKLYYDAFEMNAHLVSNPATRTSSLLNWNEYAAGTVVSLTHNIPQGAHTGFVTLGGAVDYMEVTQSKLPGQSNGTATSGNKPLKNGNEKIYSGFGQIKYWLTPRVLTNMGFRYDYKDRKPAPGVEDIDSFSPRLSLIYTPGDVYSYRLSYGHSFVDAPYWYRNNAFASYQGAATLRPEQLDSYQFSITADGRSGLRNELNFFYNDLKDMIFRTGLPLGQQQYDNAGKVESHGVEYEIQFTRDFLSLRSNYTYQLFDEVKRISVKDNRLESVPRHMANVIVDVAPFYSRGGAGKRVWLNGTARYIGEQYSRWGKLLAAPRTTVDSAIVCDFALSLEDVLDRGVSFRVSVHNAFAKEYFQGGSVEYPIEQPGRFVLAELSAKF